MTFTEHIKLRSKGLSINKLAWVDCTDETITFPLWTTCGNLVGYQQYNWKADKLRNNDTHGKYWTYRRKDVLTAWGIDQIKLNSTKPLYIVEGVWDCISVLATGRDCIAVLSNHPKSLKGWLSCLPRKTIAICDGDKAGKALAKVTDSCIILPENRDPNDLELSKLEEILSEPRRYNQTISTATK